MHRLAAVAAAGALVFGLAGSAVAGELAEPLPERPNIILFYLDDVSPHDGSLWNDPARTPNIAEHFVERGIEFSNAIGETPLCCPGRANLLTGLHTHNTGVIRNDALLFDPSEHIGKAMQDAGYASMYIGKYLNGNSSLSPQQWLEHDAGWTQLDVIKGVNGSFNNFTWHTKQGESQVNNVHSTQMVANAAVARFQQTPAETPIFAVLSTYNLHAPNRPMPQDVGDPRCAGIPRYNPPNYNEADVSDKPSGIRALPLLAEPNGWSLVRYCEEMLGVDRAIGQVIDELEAEGRLDNTLMLFTADNGMGWGAHRIGQKKTWPYTTPLPLYMRWPAAGWGDEARRINDVVSNIDLAPTFCVLAETCVLGPFAHGRTGPDGLSLVPLINGGVPNLARDAVLEAYYVNGGMSYAALRTTAAYDSDKRWHYIEYVNGEKELYDVVADEWEMTSVASGPAYADVVADLHARLVELRVDGIGQGSGEISITLDVTPNRSTDYSFEGDLGPFALDDDTDAALPNQQTFRDLPAGRYTVTRPPIAPWVPLDIDCDGVHIDETTVGRIAIYVHPGEQVSCIFTDTGPLPRPDAMVALTTAGPYMKDNLYQQIATTKQAVRRNGVKIGVSYDYQLRLQNDALFADSLIVRSERSGPSTVKVKYLFKGTDVTAKVSAGTFTLPSLAPGATAQMVIRLTIGTGTPLGSVFKATAFVSSATDPSMVDSARAVAAR